MTREEEEFIERYGGSRLASMSADEVERYWAEREERERVAAGRAARRAHFLHQLGVCLMWLATLSIAYGAGYTHDRTLAGQLR